MHVQATTRFLWGPALQKIVWSDLTSELHSAQFHLNPRKAFKAGWGETMAAQSLAGAMPAHKAALNG